MRGFKVRKEDRGFNKFLTKAVRIFKRPADIVNTEDAPLEHKAIFVSNHCGAKGPFNLTTAFRKIDHKIMTWSSWETGGNFRERWNYFYHIFYRKKLHYSRPRAWISATLFAPIYPVVFRYAGLIPVYRGTKIKTTYEYTMQALDEDVSVIIFPENSENGYDELPAEFRRGFLLAARLYLKTRGADIPIYPVYYCPGRKKAYIGEPLYYGELSECMTENEMCEEFVRRIHALAERYGNGMNEAPVAESEPDGAYGARTVTEGTESL